MLLGLDLLWQETNVFDSHQIIYVKGRRVSGLRGGLLILLQRHPRVQRKTEDV